MNGKSVGGILIHDGKFALVSNRGRSYTIPKGHIEKGETELDTLRREVHEETGVSDFEIITRLGEFERASKGIDKRIIVVYILKTDISVLKPIDFRNPEAFWVTFDEAMQKITHVEDKAFLTEKRSEVEKYI